MARGFPQASWDWLVRRIANDRCVPFIGAGANSGLLPAAGKLSQRIAEKYKYPLDDQHELMRVAQFVSVMHDATEPKLEVATVFREELNDQARVLGVIDDRMKPLRALAELDFPVYITTNYDDLLTRALRRAEKDPVQDFCRWNDQLRVTQSHNAPALPVFDVPSYRPTVKSPLVFHLHGYLQYIDSLVLTEDDYLRFLVNLTKDRDVLPSALKQYFSRTLLFVGYGLADWNLRVILRGLAAADLITDKSVAIQLEPTDYPDCDAAVAYLEKYYSKREIEIEPFWGSAEDFVVNLMQQWDNRPDRKHATS